MKWQRANSFILCKSVDWQSGQYDLSGAHREFAVELICEQRIGKFPEVQLT